MTNNTLSQIPIPPVADIETPELQFETPGQIAWRRFKQHKLAVAASIVLLLIAILSFGAPLFTPYDPMKIDLTSITQSPSREHIFGTDNLGRDVYTRTIYGGRVSLSVGLAAATLATAIGVTLGAISGYFGGPVDNLLMRFTDVMMTFPPLIIMLTVAAFANPGILTVIIIIGGLRWMDTTRLVRGQMLALKNQEFILAAESQGLPDRIIITRHSLPNTVAPLMAMVSFAVSAAILAEAGLSFLGLGIPLPIPTWGNMMEAARDLVVLQNYPWMWIPAAFFVLLTILCINFIGDGLRDAFDPQQLID
jgi:peptide/nickel transport system permease protein